MTLETAIVTGAGRGFGRAIAAALTATGLDVVGVARTPGAATVAADATDGTVARKLLTTHRPSILVLNAGAQPPVRPLHDLTWADFGVNWEVDTRHVFEWTRAALRLPLAPGSTVVAVSSGAALNGSPLSGGYAGASAAIRFVARYAADESGRAGLGIRFMTLFPQLTPDGIGAAAVAAYAAREGIDLAAFTARMSPVLTPDAVGAAVVALLGADPAPHTEYLLTGTGPRSVP